MWLKLIAAVISIIAAIAEYLKTSKTEYQAKAELKDDVNKIIDEEVKDAKIIRNTPAANDDELLIPPAERGPKGPGSGDKI